MFSDADDCEAAICASLQAMDLQDGQSQEEDLWQEAEVTEDSLITNNTSDFTPEPRDMHGELQGLEQSSATSDTTNTPLCAAALPRLCVVQV